MSLETTIFTHSGITSNFMKIAEYMHSRYTNYLIAGLNGDSKISDIVDGWKEAEKIYENVGSADNLVSEINKLLGGDNRLISNKGTTKRVDADFFDGGEDLVDNNESMQDSNLLDEILNVKKERFSFVSDEDDKNQSSGKSTSDMDLMYNYDSEKLQMSNYTENGRKPTLLPETSENKLSMFPTLPSLSTSIQATENNQNHQNHQNLQNHQHLQNQQTSHDKTSKHNLRDLTNDNFNSLLNRPSLLYVNSETYNQRLHDPHTKSKQHLRPEKLVDPFGNPTGQIRGKYKGQVEVPSTSLIYDHQEFTMNDDNRLQCDWEGCTFSTPRRTALKRHIQCIHMDVRNYGGESEDGSCGEISGENNGENNGEKESENYPYDHSNPEVVEAKKQLEQVKQAAERAKNAAETRFQDVISSIKPLGKNSATFEDYAAFNIYQMKDNKLITKIDENLNNDNKINDTKTNKKANNHKWRCAFCHHIFPANFTAYHVKRHQNSNRSGHIEELRLHLSNTNMNAAFYACTFGSCGKRFKRTDHLRGHMKRCRYSKATEVPEFANEASIDKVLK